MIETLLSVALFIKVFMIVFSILYCIKIGYDITKVWVLQEGKVEFGKYGLLYLGMAIAYVITCIIV